MSETQPTPTDDRLAMNKEQAIEAVADALQLGLHNVIQGAQDDIREFVMDLARLSSKVAAEPNPEVRRALMKSLRSQAKMLAELNRIRVVNESNSTLERVLLTATAVLANVLVKSVVPPPA